MDGGDSLPDTANMHEKRSPHVSTPYVPGDIYWRLVFRNVVESVEQVPSAGSEG